MLLMIDNYDSFTYNLVQYFGELGQEVKVFRNDEISIEDVRNLNPEYLVIFSRTLCSKTGWSFSRAYKNFQRKISNSWSLFRTPGNR